MKLAVSNIAWSNESENALLPVLSELGVVGIEVAPTKIAPDWERITPAAVAAYRAKLDAHGFAIPAMQSILFGRPDLQVFDPATHRALLAHIERVARIGADLGAKVLVFGAPRNRKRGQLSITEAWPIATEIAAKMAAIVEREGVILGWEHNPVEYGCDFVTNAADTRELVTAVNSLGLQLHLDSAGLHLCGGEIDAEVAKAAPFCHYHASEPMLLPLAGGVVDHAKAIEAVRRCGCVDWVSIEMKEPPADASDTLVHSVRLLARIVNGI